MIATFVVLKHRSTRIPVVELEEPTFDVQSVDDAARKGACRKPSSLRGTHNRVGGVAARRAVAGVESAGRSPGSLRTAGLANCEVARTTPFNPSRSRRVEHAMG